MKNRTVRVILLALSSLALFALVRTRLPHDQPRSAHAPAAAAPVVQAVTPPAAAPAAASFRPMFATAVEGELMSSSSPSLADLDHDGVLDIVFGTGVQRLPPGYDDPPVAGYVVAVSGATNQRLWQAPNPSDAFTTPRFADLNRDGTLDVIMGGRQGAFGAFDGRSGARLWRVQPSRLATTPFPYCFFTPALIRDVNADAVADLVVTYGGDDTKMPSDARDPGYVALISGRDGAVLAVHRTPDGAETYASPVVYDRPDGQQWLVFGTGGETAAGSAYRVPVAALRDGSFDKRVERLLPPGNRKGVIAPATLVELTGDAELDLVLDTFDGQVIAIDGRSGKPLWSRSFEGEETYHQAAVLRSSARGELALFVSEGIGVFPAYRGSAHRLLAAADGRVLYEYKDEQWPGGAPLAVDLGGDGVDEALFFSTSFSATGKGTVHILELAQQRLTTHELGATFGTTPALAAVGSGRAFELIGLACTGFDLGASAWHKLHWQLRRLQLAAAAPQHRSWAGYMGTFNDGHYRPADASEPAP